MTTVLGDEAMDVRKMLLPYTAALVAAMVAVQGVIAATGGSVGLLAGVLTAAVAGGIAVWYWRARGRLVRVRFGPVIAHVIAFVVVTTSFTVHALVRAVVLRSEVDGFATTARELLTTPWFGVTLGMGALWGSGLLLHLVGSVLGRGWED